MSRRGTTVASLVVAITGMAGAGAALGYWATTDASSSALAAGDTIPAGFQPTLDGIHHPGRHGRR